VVVSDDFIEVWTYGGRHIKSSWLHIDELREIGLISRMSAARVICLQSRDERGIRIQSDIQDFSRLLQIIVGRAAHARRSNVMTLHDRLYRWGF